MRKKKTKINPSLLAIIGIGLAIGAYFFFTNGGIGLIFKEAPPLCADAPSNPQCSCLEGLFRHDAFPNTAQSGTKWVCEPAELFLDPATSGWEDRAVAYYQSVLAGECQSCNSWECPAPAEMSVTYGLSSNNRRSANVECTLGIEPVGCSPTGKNQSAVSCNSAVQIARLEFWIDDGSFVRPSDYGETYDGADIPYSAKCARFSSIDFTTMEYTIDEGGSCSVYDFR